MNKNNSEPLVSIIMPAYNAEQFIAESIESVICQTYKNIELIIVDDCSGDKTVDIIKKYSYSVPTTLLLNKETMGISYTTNLAIANARGKYIALLDDDDVNLKDRIMLEVNFLENNMQIDMVGGKTIFIDSTGNILRYGNTPRNNPRLIYAMLLFHSLDFMNSTVMFRKSVWDKFNLHYKENCYGMQDYRFFIDFSKVGNISSIDEFLVKHRYHANNATNSFLSKDERKEAYRLFQIDSLKLSGFELSESEFELLTDVIKEGNISCENMEKFVSFTDLMINICKQGYSEHIDYMIELELEVRRLVGKAVPLKIN